MKETGETDFEWPCTLGLCNYRAYQCDQMRHQIRLERMDDKIAHDRFGWATGVIGDVC